MDEIWRPVDGYPDYEVSNLGRVRSFKRYRDGKILKLKVDAPGYLRVGLSRNGKQKLLLVHRLVALAFIPNPDNKPEVDHIDTNKFNNCVENLAWVTSSENQFRAFKTGSQVPRQGEAHHNARLTVEQVLYIRENPDNLTGKQLAEMFGVSEATISMIQRNKRWRSVGGKIHKSSVKKPRK